MSCINTKSDVGFFVSVLIFTPRQLAPWTPNRQRKKLIRISQSWTVQQHLKSGSLVEGSAPTKFSLPCMSDVGEFLVNLIKH